MKRLFIDVGSTNIKYAYESGEVRRIPFPPACADDGIRFEVDSEKIVRAVKEIVDSADCKEVFFSVQMHGYVLADGAGNALTNYISWRDRRALAAGVEVKMRKENGVDMKPNLPRAGVEAIARTQPELFARAREFFTLGSYLAYALTGVNATHITDAAPSGFFDVRTVKKEACALRLPRTERQFFAVGKYRGKTIFSPAGDQQCAYLGACGRERGMLLNLGTAAQMCVAEEGFAVGEFESRPYFGGGTLCTVTGLSGGYALGGREITPQALAKEYSGAMARLPAREGLTVTGGVLRYQRALVEETLNIMGVTYRLHEGEDAIAGLKILSEEFI